MFRRKPDHADYTEPAQVIEPRAERPLFAIVLMAIAMLLIPGADGIAKHLSTDLSPLFISWARYLVASLLLAPVAFALKGRDALPRGGYLPQVMRTVFLVSAMSLYFVAIATVPLATAISAFFIAPIAAAVLSVPLLGERLTGRKIAALVLGFLGVLLIVNPTSGFEPGLLLAIAAGILFACYMVATRKAVSGSGPLATLNFQCILGALVLTPQAIYAWSWPNLDQLPFFLAIGLISVGSHILSITAMRNAEASLLSPLVYLELVGSVIIGFAFFNEVPGLMVLAGAAIIVGSGLMLVVRRKPRVHGMAP
ncbi:DMT family transporter [Tepidamorphus sp. 3E244]|uniref:DMT family transporter n=1 Tax=Tepidamorphus sp. 3E244 TaxID=3385498 RepID=UPI0038FCD8A2